MNFTASYTYVFHQRAHTFFKSFIKTLHIDENMTFFPRGSTEETGWGHADSTSYPRELFAPPLNMHCRTRTLQRPSKQLKPSHASLFDLLTTGILADIEIWVSGLEHCSEFKNIIL